MSFDLIFAGLLQSGVLMLLAFAVMVPFKFLQTPDLSVEGAYITGATICSLLLLSQYTPPIAMLIAMVLSTSVSLLTAFFHLQLRLNCLLAGLVVIGMFHSINLRMLGAPNLSLFYTSSILTTYGNYPMIVMMVVSILVYGLFTIFLYTRAGLEFRAVGKNKKFASYHHIPFHTYVYTGFAISGAIGGLAGSLVVQLNRYMDIGLGIGSVLQALAALMLGEVILDAKTSMLRQILSPMLGAIVYQQVSGLVLDLGFAPTDFRLLTGCMILAIFYIKQVCEV